MRKSFVGLVILFFLERNRFAALETLINYEYCRNGEHIIGEWVFNSSAEKSFYCCGWDDVRYYTWNTSICRQDAVHNKYWRHQHYPFRGNDSFMSPVNRGCHYDLEHGFYSVNPIQKYSWVPSFCDLPQWNAQRFCKLLGKRQILFLGDSTMMQSALTLMSMITMQHGGCSSQLGFYRNDLLKLNIFAFNEIMKPDIMVFTNGAHVLKLEEFKLFWLKFSSQIIERRRAHPTENITYVWKSQNPPHRNCNISYSPIRAFHHYTEMDAYSWVYHPIYDQISKRYAKELGMPLIDMTPLYLRPDAHVVYLPEGKNGNVDCMHYVTPGPVDLFSQLFLTMLENEEI